MSFDAALNHLIEAHEGPLGEEMGRIPTELRIGESRRAALRSFTDRVGTESAIAFANAVLASTTSDRLSPGSCEHRRATCGTGGRCMPRSGLRKRR